MTRLDDATRARAISPWRVVVVAACVAVVIAFLYYSRDVVRFVLEEVGLRPATVRVAVYHEMAFVEGNGMYVLTTGEDCGLHSESVANIYVTVDNGPPIKLQELSETEISRVLSDGSQVGNTTPDEEKCYTGGFTIVCFRNGKIVSATFHPDERFKFGVHENGPFYALPIDRDLMEEVFGKPDYWERSRAGGV